MPFSLKSFTLMLDPSWFFKTALPEKFHAGNVSCARSLWRGIATVWHCVVLGRPARWHGVWTRNGLREWTRYMIPDTFYKAQRNVRTQTTRQTHIHTQLCTVTPLMGAMEATLAPCSSHQGYSQTLDGATTALSCVDKSEHGHRKNAVGLWSPGQ